MEAWAYLGMLIVIVGAAYVLTVANKRAGREAEQALAHKKLREAQDEANRIARDVARRGDAAERLRDEFSRD